MKTDTLFTIGLTIVICFGVLMFVHLLISSMQEDTKVNCIRQNQTYFKYQDVEYCGDISQVRQLIQEVKKDNINPKVIYNCTGAFC